MKTGLTFVICTHNGAARIQNVLRCIAKQHVRNQIPYEAIVVNNASTDNTADLADSCHSMFQPGQLRIVHENQLGLIFARQCGVKVAKFHLISFIDDDNFVEPHWVEKAVGILKCHPEVGALGGRTEPIYETVPPAWYHKYGKSIAVGCQSEISGDITEKEGRLWGAGLTIRKKAWEDLEGLGHKFHANGRQGKLLLSGEDTELCYALRLAGWRLWYDENLLLKHKISSNRLSWKYLMKLFYGLGMSEILLHGYLHPLGFKKSSANVNWMIEVLKNLLLLLRIDAYTYLNFIRRRKDKYNVLKIKKIFGRIIMLFNIRKKYSETIHQIVAFSANCNDR